MHMQEGIGRNGYRVLSGVFFGLGLLGLGSTLYAFPPSPDLFDWLGFSLSLVAFAVLFGLILVVLQKPLGARPMTVKPVADTATAKPPAAAP
ncbi:MAG TPA: hypothetical protein VI796_01450, partial [Candidatus Thermoplasmatota archaeon]|nr:hypothetical protein [Candidatus Thermoplasmatota archaeon]